MRGGPAPGLMLGWRHSEGLVRSSCGNALCGAKTAPQQRFRMHLLPERTLWRQNGATAKVSAAVAAKSRPVAPITAPSPRRDPQVLGVYRYFSKTLLANWANAGRVSEKAIFSAIGARSKCDEASIPSCTT